MHVDFKFETATRNLLDIINSDREGILHTFRTTPDSIPEVFKGQFIVFPDFADYMLAYFNNGPVLENAFGFIDELGYKPPYENEQGDFIRMRTVSRYADDSLHQHFNSDGTRSSQSYILEKEELAEAKKFIADNPSFHVGIAALQGCLASYMDDLIEDMRKVAAADGDNDLKYILARIDGEFAKNTNSDSFLRDMSPLVALALSKKGPDFNAGDLKDPGVLRSFFDRQAFKSSAYFPGNVPDTRKCPFAPNFAEVMSVDISRNSDGTFTSQKGRFGDTLEFIMDKINLSPEQKARVTDSMHL